MHAMNRKSECINFYLHLFRAIPTDDVISYYERFCETKLPPDSLVDQKIDQLISQKKISDIEALELVLRKSETNLSVKLTVLSYLRETSDRRISEFYLERNLPRIFAFFNIFKIITIFFFKLIKGHYLARKYKLL